MESVVRDVNATFVKTLNIESARNFLVPVLNVSTAIPPQTPALKGNIAYDIISDQIWFANGTVWTQIGGGGGGGSPSGPAGGDLAGTYPNPTIAPGVITAAQIAPGSITSTQIANNTITAAQIAPGTITSTQIANNTITSANILDGTITGTDIAPGAITSTQIANNTITSANILDGTITGTDIANNTITSANILDGTITSTQIANNTITSANILDGTITGTDIANNTITAAQLDATPAGPGPWTNANITLDSSGRVIAASNGSSSSINSKLFVRNSTPGTFVVPGSGFINLNSQIGTTVGWTTSDGGNIWTTTIDGVYQVNATVFNGGGGAINVSLATTQQTISFTIGAGQSCSVSIVVELLNGHGISLTTSAGATIGGLSGAAARTTMSVVAIRPFP